MQCPGNIRINIISKKIKIEKNKILAPFTTLRVGGPAEYFAMPKNKFELKELLLFSKRNKLEINIIGGGSNLLISDTGVSGLVIKLEGEFKEIKISDCGYELFVGAGVSFPKLTRKCLELGWEKALGWCGTPGLVGGALKMNAGTRLGEIGDLVCEVEAVCENKTHKLSHNNMGFKYRKTSFNKSFILSGAKLVCQNSNLELKENLLAKAKDLAVQRKKSQPKSRTAGSMFKNPKGDFAGRLIESAGLKGRKYGGARVSSVHANFFVNTGSASASDILCLSQIVRECVYDKFKIELEYEVRRWGF